MYAYIDFYLYLFFIQVILRELEFEPITITTNIDIVLNLITHIVR